MALWKSWKPLGTTSALPSAVLSLPAGGEVVSEYSFAKITNNAAYFTLVEKRANRRTPASFVFMRLFVYRVFHL